MELRVRVVVADTSRRSDRGPPISPHVPGESKPGSKFQPVSLSAGFAGKARITRKVEAQRRFRKDGAAGSSGATLFAIGCDSAQSKSLGEIGLPSQPVV